jgi:hypothetical protein
MQGRYWVTSRSSLIATLRLVGLEIEIIGDIAHMIEMGIEDKKERACPQREDGPFGKGGCGGWICSRTYQVDVEAICLGWLRGPATTES